MQRFMLDSLPGAARRLREGAVLAYPTEAVFGLGCDPHDRQACARVFALKRRPPTRGVLLIAADWRQIERYVDWEALPGERLALVQASWPGPTTWILPRSEQVPEWIAGGHAGIALRITAHAPAAALCREFGGAIVSTSANPHGQPPALSLAVLESYFGDALGGALDAPLGGRLRPSEIRDALTDVMIRP